MSPRTPSRGLATAIEAEHAAVAVLAVLGGRASTTEDDRLVADLDDAYDAHVETRDRLVRLAGRQAPVAKSAYAVPTGISRPSGIRRAALRVEQACAAAILTAIGEVDVKDREPLVEALGATAVRELAFGGGAVAFPGTD